MMDKKRGNMGIVQDRLTGLARPGANPEAVLHFSQSSFRPLSRLVCTVLLVFLFLGGRWAFASDLVYELRFEKRKALTKKEDVFTYTIEKGDYVYAILRDFNVPENRLEEMEAVVRTLNPQLEDLDRVKPGDPLHLPGTLQGLKTKNGKQGLRQPGRGDAGSVQSMDYRIKPGDTVLQILREETGLSKKVELEQYLRIFRRLNPGLKDIDRIVTGQKLRVPLPSALAGARGQKGAAQVRETGLQNRASEEKPSERGRSGLDQVPPVLEAGEIPEKDLVQSILEQTGLDFVSGSEILLPGSSQSWIRINLEHMGLARTKWGDSILFVPGALQDNRDELEFSGAGLKTCLIPESWERNEVFRHLEEITRPRLIFWPPDKRLILNFQGGSLELESNCLLANRLQGEVRFYLFDSSRKKKAGPPGLLIGFLQSMGVNYLIPVIGAHGIQGWQAPLSPNRDNLFVPTLSRSDFLPELKAILPQDELPLMDVRGGFASVFPVLKVQGRAREESLQIKLYQTDEISVSLRLSVFRISFPSGEFYLLSKGQDDPYLVSMLNMMGYNAYLLQGN
ncbi:MAG: LysM peptidoglycan-binding domain-containing protein [Desulfohalobiaceae bacterium]|nr:LysM peptidoglycan-binding domain-containing protein [Desulfohalobiaceae bacterium]